MKKDSKRRKLERRRVKRALGRLLAADAGKPDPQTPAIPKAGKKRGPKRKYATEAEARAAAKAYQVAYRKARRDGTWMRKNKVHSKRIAVKLGIATSEEEQMAEQRKARESRKRAAGLKRAERLARREFIKLKYGFDPATFNKVPQTPEAVEGRKRWLRDQEAEYRERHHDRITAYNREYRRKRRAAQFAEAQKSWTEEEWEAWRRREDAKANRPGTPHWLVREAVKAISDECGRPQEDVTAELIENGGVDFLLAGARSLGADKAARRSSVVAAVDALRLYLGSDSAFSG